MKDMSAILLEDGLDILFEKLGVTKTIKFIQLLTLGSGDALKEIETKTEKMTKDEALKFIDQIREKNKPFWKKTGLL